MANATQTRHSVAAWLFDGMLAERYRYAPGPLVPVPRHVHEEYQFGFSADCGCHYAYRGAHFPAPTGSLCALHPGEAHQPHGENFLDHATVYEMLLVPAPILRQISQELGGRSDSLPYVAQPILDAPDVIRLYRAAHYASHGPESRLTQDSLMLAFLTRLVTGFAETRRPLPKAGREARRIRRACDYLRAHLAENVALAEIARLADLTPCHFLRVFRSETGLTPHVYQTQARIERAKILLLGGVKPSETAALTGFYDQSHFGQHFKRLVGVTPARYAAPFPDLFLSVTAPPEQAADYPDTQCSANIVNAKIS